MKFKLHLPDYITVFKYLLSFFLLLVFNNLEGTVYPYSSAIFVSMIYLNDSLIFSPAIFLLSFLITKNFGYILPSFITCVLVIPIKILYKKTKVGKFYEFLALVVFSTSGFLIFGNTQTYIDIYKRLTVSAIILFLSVFCMIAGRAITEKGFKMKFNREEIISIATTTVCFGLGISNLISPFVWKGIYIFAVLMSSFLLRFGLGIVVSSILGITLSVYYGNIEYLAASLMIGISADGLKTVSRYLSAVGVVITDILIETLFKVYGEYGINEFLPVIISATLFFIIPNAPLLRLKEKLYSFREKQLVRQAINRNRLMVSNRLYELSGVFNEMAQAFDKFGSSLSKEKAKTLIEKELTEKVCGECTNKLKCKRYESELKSSLYKMTEIGFAKGKVSLIDLPKEISEKCVKPNEILYGLNKMLSEFRSYELENQNVITGRKLIAKESLGVSEILRGLALESGTLLKYQSRTERTLFLNLQKSGICVSELLIYGESEKVTVCMILSMREFPLSTLLSVIEKTVGYSMTLVDKNNLTEDKVYLTFKKATEFDAVFGLSCNIKDGSNISGDTHSVIKISDDKFLVAISDGMGSGKSAEAVSSVSLSLIESFYKAGIQSELILDTVNKLLSINSEDSFTALDISVIDLKKHSADFIKYGSPYGFILCDGAVKIIEGNSLPLGILDDLKPIVCHTELNDGDIVLLTSDGISDAFGASSDFIDFLRKAPSYNPQALADEVLKKAIEISGGKKKDDMTVLAVRIFKKSA